MSSLFILRLLFLFYAGMVCPICHNPDGPCEPGDLVLHEFDVVLNESCFRHMYIPYNFRAFVAYYIDEQRDAAMMLQYKKVEPALLTYEGRSYPPLFKH